MKRRWTKWGVLVFLAGLLVVFRGPLYRLTVSYQILEPRPSSRLTDPRLISYIDGDGTRPGAPVEAVIEQALRLTSARLEFAATRTEDEPNRLFDWRRSHCVGNAAFFAVVCNRLLQKHGLDDWSAAAQVGRVHLLGMNVHPWLHPHLHPSFFEDHDFATISHSKTGAMLAVDPTAHEFFRVGLVTLR